MENAGPENAANNHSFVHHLFEIFLISPSPKSLLPTSYSFGKKEAQRFLLT